MIVILIYLIPITALLTMVLSERYLIRSLDRFNPFLIKAKDYLVHASDFFYYMIQHNIQTSHGADVNQMA